MFLTFSVNKREPDASAALTTASPEDCIRIREPNPPSYAVAVDVFVCKEPEVDTSNNTETWVVDKQPERHLARGHILTLRLGDQVIGSDRISAVDGLTRHWVTFRLAGARDGMRVRVPVPWVGLSGYMSYTHTSQYHALAPTPEAHSVFKNSPPFADPDANPYEFELTTGKEIRLLAKLKTIASMHEQTETVTGN
ncbi:uncharacterized protein C8Q71DRAFT_750089 [Rhodofomes roseus]|uniref:Uncharacterized protein n=1 Tax=Rhodofomes roseus TaxID=34475 RepID=A0ABQ8KKY3_9APHY|nr:uncharacterized protein C8Q71DRAFT_750089 [Rhodofomes roseus]KAH9838227.1 hypothetical protein C8Q71DRAFT_750089 [Rhodofomes roseus]